MSKYRIEVKYGELDIYPNRVEWKHHGYGWWCEVGWLPWRRDPMKWVIVALERLHRAELKWQQRTNKLAEITDFAKQLSKDLEKLNV